MDLAALAAFAATALAWATLGVSTEAAWIAYTVHARLWPAMIEPVLMVASNVMLAGAIIRAGAPARRPVLFGVAWGSVLAGAGLTAGWTVLGAVLGVAYAVQVSPAIVAAYRTPVPSGVAPVTWAATLVEGLLWGFYGAARRDPAVMVFAVVATVSASVVLARWVTTRRRVSPRPSLGDLDQEVDQFAGMGDVREVVGGEVVRHLRFLEWDYGTARPPEQAWLPAASVAQTR
jgi:hypothetical protein